MDALTGLLDQPRARGAFLLRTILNPPWSLRIADGSPLSLIMFPSGLAWILKPGAPPAPIGPGDVAVVSGTEPYVVADHPATRPRLVIRPGQICESVDGTPVPPLDVDARTWGAGPADAAVMISGTYQLRSEVGRRLLDALPGLLIRPAATGDRALIDLLVREMNGTEPGQELVLDRLLDLVLVSVLRSWLSTPDTGAPGWYKAQTDPVIGPVLRLMHDEPAYGWTVTSLAARGGVSRASLARRFTEVVGEPPMAYLTGWRIALAADLLRQDGATIAAVARRVGYGSAYALSTAFKRERGVSPQEYRRRPAEAPRPMPEARVVRLA